MTVQPIEFLLDTFPKLFARGVEVLESRASAGDERAQRILDDVKGVTGAASLQIDDRSPVVLSARAGALSAGDGPADGVPIKITAGTSGRRSHLVARGSRKNGRSRR